jgi:hypothetical protein
VIITATSVIKVWSRIPENPQDPRLPGSLANGQSQPSGISLSQLLIILLLTTLLTTLLNFLVRWAWASLLGLAWASLFTGGPPLNVSFFPESLFTG